MGWTVLYIAFGVVALWLLGEVLFQYKARLRWRLLAFGGFLCVVLGAVMPSVVVIAIGIAAFATGQTFVTLSYRRGFSTGWALGGSPGSSRRRRGPAPREAEPSLEVSDLQTYDPGAYPDEADAYGPSGYQHSEPALVGDAAAHYAGGDHGGGYPDGGYPDGDYYSGAYGAEFDPYGNQSAEAPAYATNAAWTDPAYANPADGTPAYPAQPAGAQAYAYADDQQQYARSSDYSNYSDPYLAYDGAGYDPQGNLTGSHLPYDQAGYGGYGTYDDYGSYGYAASPMAPMPPPPQDQPQQAPYYPDVPETPPGGVWVPQQRDAGMPPLPPDQPQAPPSSYGYGEAYPPYPNGYFGTDQRGGY